MNEGIARFNHCWQAYLAIDLAHVNHLTAVHHPQHISVALLMRMK